MIDIASAPLLDEFMENALEGAYENGGLSAGFRVTFLQLYEMCRNQGDSKIISLGVLDSALRRLMDKYREPAFKYDVAEELSEGLDRMVEFHDFSADEKELFSEYTKA